MKPDSDQPSTNYLRNAKMMLAPFLTAGDKDDEEVDDIFSHMKETGSNAGVRETCRNDLLIREFATALLDRLGTTTEQRRKDKDNIRTKLRTVGRLLKHLNEAKFRPQSLSSYITGKQFIDVVKAVKALSMDSNSPSLAISLGNHLKHIYLLKISLAIQSDDQNMRKEAVDFKELYEAHWNAKVASVSNRRLKLRSLNKEVTMPSTEDLVTLKSFLDEKIQEAMKTENPTYDEWVRLAQMALVKMVLLNKRRISEVDELKLMDYSNRCVGRGVNQDIYESLDVSEKALINR